jgi:tRNA 2-thiocytidine biosynthesis protein TtcA
MPRRVRFNRLCAKWFVADMLEAIDRHGMIAAGDTVAIALSGDLNSTALLYMLNYMNHYSPLSCRLAALHIRTSHTHDTAQLRRYCDELGVKYLEGQAEMATAGYPTEDAPALRSRSVRAGMAKALTRHGIGTAVFAHNANDIAEMFFVNLVRINKPASLSPRVEPGDGSPVVIRPMVYLPERVIRRVHSHFGLPCVPCQDIPGEDDLRVESRRKVGEIDNRFGIKAFARSVVDSLESVDESDIWSQS